MKLLLDILQGAGVGAACGIRPFLPALAVGALARANVGVNYDHTKLAFLEKPWFLLVLAVLLAASFFFRAPLRRPQGEAALTVAGAGLGGLEFAGTIADHHSTWWPGLIAGALLALLGNAAVRDLFTRVRTRLDAAAAGALPIYGEGVAVVAAALCVIAPPVSILVIGFLIWLLAGGKRRGGEKYAGLRSLR